MSAVADARVRRAGGDRVAERRAGGRWRGENRHLSVVFGLVGAGDGDLLARAEAVRGDCRHVRPVAAGPRASHRLDGYRVCGNARRVRTGRRRRRAFDDRIGERRRDSTSVIVNVPLISMFDAPVTVTDCPLVSAGEGAADSIIVTVVPLREIDETLDELPVMPSAVVSTLVLVGRERRRRQRIAGGASADAGVEPARVLQAPGLCV